MVCIYQNPFRVISLLLNLSVYAMDEHQDSMMNDAFAKFYAVKELKFLFVFCTILALSNT
jgi:hypothetical protein